MAAIIQPADRTYIPNKEEFGYVKRTNLLGLSNAPVIELDDGKLIAFAGAAVKSNVVLTATGKNLNDEVVELPLDIRVVGIQVMDSLGINKDTQSAMFSKYITLDRTVKQSLTDQYNAAKASGLQEDISAFVNRMITELTA